MSHPYPPHLPNFSYVGKYVYSLTFCTYERRVIFVDSDSVRLAFAQILRAADEKGFEITTYCFMPDHVHLIVTGLGDNSDAKAFIKAAKQYSAHHFAEQRRTRLWARYGYERVMRDATERAMTMRYIVENPVRAGLVRSALEYPHVGSDVWSLEELILSVQI